MKRHWFAVSVLGLAFFVRLASQTKLDPQVQIRGASATSVGIYGTSGGKFSLFTLDPNTLSLSPAGVLSAKTGGTTAVPVQQRDEFQITAGQTAFATSISTSIVGPVDVYMNGQLLKPNLDYQITGAGAVTLNTAASDMESITLRYWHN